jgi:hypothetical protein
MEQAQLFKRLFDMSLDRFCSFIDHDETIEKALYKLDMGSQDTPHHSCCADRGYLAILG